jgi:hypothetical protein
VDETERFIEGLDAEVREYMEALRGFLSAIEGAAQEYGADPHAGAASAVAAALALCRAIGLADPRVTAPLGDLLIALYDLNRGHVAALLRPAPTQSGRPAKLGTDEAMGRAHAAAAVDALMATGESLIEAAMGMARELGVPGETILGWRKALRERAAIPGDFDAQGYYRGLLAKAKGQSPAEMAKGNLQAAAFYLGSRQPAAGEKRRVKGG